jgi:hypothetical protein
MNLETPPGLPCGDEAVLAHVDGEPDGLLFFVDGDKACTPMNAPPALLSLVDRVAAGEPIIKELPPGKSRSVDQRMKAERGISSPAADTSSHGSSQLCTNKRRRSWVAAQSAGIVN